MTKQEKIIAKQKELIKNLTNQLFFGGPPTYTRLSEFNGLFDEEGLLRNEIFELESEQEEIGTEDFYDD